MPNFLLLQLRLRLCHIHCAMDWIGTIANRLKGVETEGLRRVLSHSTGISFAHNDYLGLANHPRVIEAGQRALRSGPAGGRGSRLLGGNSITIEAVEAELAAWVGSPAALFFSSGYLANLAAVSAMGQLVEHLVCDEKIHASLIDGARLTRLPKTIVPHNQWNKAIVNCAAPSLWIAESLYSMDGDLVPVDALFAAAGSNLILIDEAHAAGVLRESGQGYLPAAQRQWERLCVTMTFGKAFGVAGAALFCSREMRDWLVQTARSFIYTTVVPPVVPAMVEGALRVIQDEPQRRQELWRRAEWVREQLQQLPGAIPATQPGSWAAKSPIIPLLLPGIDRALRFSQTMRELGFDFRAIRYPTVARGEERIRISVNLAASWEDTERATHEMVRVWTELSSQQ